MGQGKIVKRGQDAPRQVKILSNAAVFNERTGFDRDVVADVGVDDVVAAVAAAAGAVVEN